MGKKFRRMRLEQFLMNLQIKEVLRKVFFPHSNQRLFQNGHSLNIAFFKKLGSTKNFDRCYTNAKEPNLKQTRLFLEEEKY